jgi:hypothetical protein
MNAPDPPIALPEGWILDRVTHRRLRHQLARTKPTYVAVVAERDELPAGASCRGHAERRALLPGSDVHVLSGPSVHGAALIRPGVSFEVGDDAVSVETGSLLGDNGSVVHDPWLPLGRIEDASPLGRPPTGRRVVLFLGLEPDPYLADWVRRLVNDLLDLDVEGRIAVPKPTAGLHLTKPCAPTEQSIRALAPEVMVALDDAAVEMSAASLGLRRCHLVRLTPGTGGDVVPESLRVGRWRRQIEASFGRGIDAESLADLVDRLDPASGR